MGWSVNYFANLGTECYFPKIGCSKSSFFKKWGVSVIYPNINYKVTSHKVTKPQTTK